MASSFRRRLQQAEHAARRRAAEQAPRQAEGIRAAWDEYVAKGAALAAITQCTSVCPDFAEDVALTTCQLLQGHGPGEGDGGHRHRVLGSSVVIRW